MFYRPSSRTLTEHIDNYREAILKFAWQDKKEPTQQLKILLMFYLNKHPQTAKPFAYHLLKNLSVENDKLLAEIEKYLHRDRQELQDEFDALLAAYFYHFIDYYEVCCTLDKKVYPQLYKQLLLPLRVLRKKHQDEIIPKIAADRIFVYYLLAEKLLSADPQKYSARFVTDLIQRIPTGQDFSVHAGFILNALSFADMSNGSLARLEAILQTTPFSYNVLSSIEKILLKSIGVTLDFARLVPYLNSPCFYFRFTAINIVLTKQIPCTTQFELDQVQRLLNDEQYDIQKCACKILAHNCRANPIIHTLALGYLVDEIEKQTWKKVPILTLFAKIDLPADILERLIPLLAEELDHPTDYYNDIRLAAARHLTDPASTQKLITQLKSEPYFKTDHFEVMRYLSLSQTEKIELIDLILKGNNNCWSGVFQTIEKLCEDEVVREACMQKIFVMSAPDAPDASCQIACSILRECTIPAKYLTRAMDRFISLLQDNQVDKPILACMTLANLTLPLSHQVEIIDQLLLLTQSNHSTVSQYAYQACTHFATLIPVAKVNLEQALLHMLRWDYLDSLAAHEFLSQFTLPNNLQIRLIEFFIQNFDLLQQKGHNVKLLLKCVIPAVYNRDLLTRLLTNISQSNFAVKSQYYQVIAHLCLSAEDMNLLTKLTVRLSKYTALDQALLTLCCQLPLSEDNKKEIIAGMLERLPDLSFSDQLNYSHCMSILSKRFLFTEKHNLILKIEYLAMIKKKPSLLYLVEELRFKHFTSVQWQDKIDQQCTPSLPAEIWDTTHQYFYRR